MTIHYVDVATRQLFTNDGTRTVVIPRRMLKKPDASVRIKAWAIGSRIIENGDELLIDGGKGRAA